MKKLLFFISILFCNSLWAQTDKPQTENWTTPFGIFDTAYDGEGNAPKITDLLAGKTYTTGGVTRSSTLLCTSGFFELYLMV